MSDSYYFPRFMWGLLDQHVGQCKNLGLILDKYPPATVPGNSQAKSEWLKHLKPNGHIDTALTQAAYNRWFSMISAMGVTPFYAILDWHMVIGLGGERVLETDITLHHLYGIPFIPGSALKGLTRAYVSAEYKQYYIPKNQPEEQRKPSKKTDEDHSEIKRIFGAQERAGTVIFFDAMPLPGTITFVLDIMNSHYPDYYKSLKSEKIVAPTNDQQPNPITFLAVKGTTFAFALAPRDASKAQHVKDVEDVKGWLQEALQKYGVGGKTSAGYGYFQQPHDLAASSSSAQEPPAATTVDPDLKKAEGYKREIDALRDVAGQIHGYYQKWQQFTSEEARMLLAQAIVEKVRKAGREKASVDKAWYRELRAFLGEG